MQITDGVSAQRIAKRTADTRIAVVDGQTVVIGGLMQESADRDREQGAVAGRSAADRRLVFDATIREPRENGAAAVFNPEVVLQPDGLEALGERVRAETEEIEHTVEPGALQRHLDRLKGIPASPHREPLLVP